MKRIKIEILILAVLVVIFGVIQYKIATDDGVIKLTVAKKGGDYSLLSEALKYTAEYPGENYIIYIKNGTYHENSITYDVDNVTIIGEDVEKTVIRTDGTLDSTSVEEKHGLMCRCDITVKNITFDVNDVKYCIHNDGKSRAYNAVFENCKFVHRGCDGAGYLNPIGIGAQAGQYNSFINCTFVYDGESGNKSSGIYWHNWNNQMGAAKLLIKNCVAINCHIAYIVELGSEQTDQIIIDSCKSDLVNAKVQIRADNDYYRDASGVAVSAAAIPYNINVKIIDTPVYLDVDYEQRPNMSVDCHYPVVVNESGSTIAIGSAIKYDTSNSNKLKDFIKLSTDGILDGVAVNQFENDSEGMIAQSGDVAKVRAVSGTYAEGDYVNCNYAGEFEKTINEDKSVGIVIENVTVTTGEYVTVKLR